MGFGAFAMEIPKTYSCLLLFLWVYRSRVQGVFRIKLVGDTLEESLFLLRLHLRVTGVQRRHVVTWCLDNVRGYPAGIKMDDILETVFEQITLFVCIKFIIIHVIRWG